MKVKKLKAGFLILLSFVFGGGFGFFSGKIYPKIIPTEQKVTVDENLRSLRFITTHSLCMHETSYEETEQFFSADRNKIKQAFPNWKIVSITDDEVVMQREVPDYCNEHYFVTLKDNELCIETLNGAVLSPIDVSLYNFSDDEYQKLSNGVYLNGKEEYTSFIEDFTS